jgi:hypothetical protein
MIRVVALEITADDFVIAAGHRRIAISFVASTLTAAALSIAGLVGGL